jgi:hypothetical protein
MKPRPIDKKSVWDFVGGARSRLLRFETWVSHQKLGLLSEDDWWEKFDDFDPLVEKSEQRALEK